MSRGDVWEGQEFTWWSDGDLSLRVTSAWQWLQSTKILEGTLLGPGRSAPALLSPSCVWSLQVGGWMSPPVETSPASVCRRRAAPGWPSIEPGGQSEQNRQHVVLEMTHFGLEHVGSEEQQDIGQGLCGLSVILQPLCLFWEQLVIRLQNKDLR